MFWTFRNSFCLDFTLNNEHSSIWFHFYRKMCALKFQEHLNTISKTKYVFKSFFSIRPALYINWNACTYAYVCMSILSLKICYNCVSRIPRTNAREYDPFTLSNCIITCGVFHAHVTIIILYLPVCSLILYYCRCGSMARYICS